MVSAKERYDSMTNDRNQFLQRARANAMLTIPSLMPLEGHDGKAHLIEPYQSLGAAGVVSLTSRLALALIPAGRPHLRFDVSAKILNDMQGTVPNETNRLLSKGENLVQKKVESVNWRASTLASVAQLIVSGSVIEHMLPDGRLRIFRLDQFVMRRDHRGRVVEAVIRECFDKDALPPDLPVPEELVMSDVDSMLAKDKQVELYTHITLSIGSTGDATYTVRREAEGGLLIGKETKFSEEDLPYFFLRWSETPGEDYGRSKVEEVIADLRSLDGLEKASIELGALGAKHFIMVNPSATAAGLKNRITRINNGDVVMGSAESVELKQFANIPGHQIVDAQIGRLAERVGRAFLLSSPGQRNAERVTATEIERDIQELESTLGGTFSVLSLDMMEARTLLLIKFMKNNSEFPDTEEGVFDVTILTGLEALSRERDVQRASQAATLIQAFGEQAADQVKFDVVLNKAFIGLGFVDAIRSDEEVAARLQQRQQAEIDKAAVAPTINADSKAQAGGPPSG
jgi:hypothetical protein